MSLSDLARGVCGAGVGSAGRSEQEGRKWPGVTNKSPTSASAWQTRWQGADVLPQHSRTFISTPDIPEPWKLLFSSTARTLINQSKPDKSCHVVIDSMLWVHWDGLKCSVIFLFSRSSGAAETYKKERTPSNRKSYRQRGILDPKTKKGILVGKLVRYK